jgi:hypothetical protein
LREAVIFDGFEGKVSGLWVKLAHSFHDFIENVVLEAVLVLD